MPKTPLQNPTHAMQGLRLPTPLSTANDDLVPIDSAGFYCIINTGIIGNQHAIRNGKRAFSPTDLLYRHFSINPNERGE